MITLDCLNNMLDDSKVKVRQVAEKFNLTVTDEQINQLLEYLSLLKKWNKTYNLTAITGWDEMLVKHIFDSMSVVSFIKGKHVADIGSGGGLPGIVLAILLPETSFVLLDSVGKKTLFLKHVKRVLDLKNVIVLNIRVENYQPEIPFDSVVSRAFSSIDDFYHLCQHLLAQNGQMIAMKGADLELEALAQVPMKNEAFEVDVPLLDAKRHVVRMWRS
ncbi:16S rRNA (guanine(527)-N(7))-methyltransferase RsmG [Caedibacter taeniospiralis]|uniref:16S rRNA (guanine(527)-N(7))-methyltransferase RsmG n=1 Tax=Caedibacter taeniospiralis TaxID=28907 RepID=UPI001E5FE0A3|nr:16S rRNA (guanine(527)-N(7))-methyltransferase RsmG [Caedibacter taeniospiralis]